MLFLTVLVGGEAIGRILQEFSRGVLGISVEMGATLTCRDLRESSKENRDREQRFRITISWVYADVT